MDQLENLLTQVFDIGHWPWVAMAAIYAIIGQFTSKRLFTRERAYAEESGFWHWFWYWGRETLPIHPIAAGATTGLLWSDPEGAGWGGPASMAYFASAGVASLFAWMWLKAKAKQKGIDLKLPGASVVPKPSGD